MPEVNELLLESVKKLKRHAGEISKSSSQKQEEVTPEVEPQPPTPVNPL